MTNSLVYDPCRLVAQHHRLLDDEAADGAVGPVVDVGAADADAVHTNKDLEE